MQQTRKKADLYTGALVSYIGDKKHISTIVRTKFTAYKSLISDFVLENQLENHNFLDIHGFNQDNGFDVCIGTGYISAKDYPFLDEILQISKKFGLRVGINHPDYTGCIGFTGRYQKAVNRPDIMQIELHRKLRDFYQYPETVCNLTIPFLTEIVELYNN